MFGFVYEGEFALKSRFFERIVKFAKYYFD